MPHPKTCMHGRTFAGAGVNNPFPAKAFNTGGPGGSNTASYSVGGATIATRSNGNGGDGSNDNVGISAVPGRSSGNGNGSGGGGGGGGNRTTATAATTALDSDGYNAAAIAAAAAPMQPVADAQLENLQQETAILQNKLRETEYRRQQMDNHIAELSSRLRDADNTKTTVQSDLAIERQWRQNLVREIDEERAKLDALVTVDDELQETKERYAQLMEEHMQLRANYVQQEQSLVDLGSMVRGWAWVGGRGRGARGGQCCWFCLRTMGGEIILPRHAAASPHLSHHRFSALPSMLLLPPLSAFRALASPLPPVLILWLCVPFV